MTGQRTEDRGQRTEDRGQRTEDRGQRTEDRGQRTEDRGQRTEDRGQRTEDREQKTEDRGQKTEDRGQKTEDREQKDRRWDAERVSKLADGFANCSLPSVLCSLSPVLCSLSSALCPLVSVIVPTYRRPDLLRRCLTALCHQDLGADCYEIVVADDAASDETRRQIEEFAKAETRPIQYVPVRGAHGPAAARNAGWRASRGAVLAFTDDDCVPEPGWLRIGLAALHQDPALTAVTGRTVVPLPERPTDHERNLAGLERSEFLTANCFCRREALEAIGGFDERFALAWREDSDLHFNLLERGGKLRRVPEAVVVHPLRPAPWGNCLREQRKALFEALLYKKHPHLYRQRIHPGCPGDYYLMTAALLAATGLAIAGSFLPALGALAIWLVLMCRFLARRLRRNSLAPRHVVEMLVTSLLIPPLSIYWRLRGAVAFRVPFL